MVAQIGEFYQYKGALRARTNWMYSRDEEPGVRFLLRTDRRTGSNLSAALRGYRHIKLPSSGVEQV
jgi:hypothetical protein